MKCPDCHAEPGKPHQDGCDIARCTICGKQRITCEHGTSNVGWGEFWSGQIVRPSQQKPTPIIECDICYGLFYETRKVEHAMWHKYAASPMAHGMYLAAKMAEGTASPDGW